MKSENLARPLLRAAVRMAARAEPLLGGAVRHDGHRLDPELHAALVAAQRLHIAKIEDQEPPEARRHSAAMLARFQPPPRPMALVTDTHAPGPGGAIPVRVYQPVGARPAMIVFFHGGGGVIGSVESYDPTARLLADRTRCVIASVDYRLGPEHPHPAAIDDALAAWAWAYARASALGVDPRRVGVAGDSFGGFLAAWVQLRARTQPRVAALIYPLVDLTMTSPSIDTFAEGFLLTRAMMHWFRDHYAPDERSHRPGSPIFAADVARLGPTQIITAGFDPLRDEGAAWADRLAAAGAPVRYHCEPDLVHGFLELTGVFRRCDVAVARLCDEVSAALTT